MNKPRYSQEQFEELCTSIGEGKKAIHQEFLISAGCVANLLGGWKLKQEPHGCFTITSPDGERALINHEWLNDPRRDIDCTERRVQANFIKAVFDHLIAEHFYDDERVCNEAT